MKVYEKNTKKIDGWGTWIRTREWRYQKPLPYRLAIPHHFKQINTDNNGAGSKIRTRDLSITNRLHYHCAMPAIPLLI